jgi:hypothetical protein
MFTGAIAPAADTDVVVAQSKYLPLIAYLPGEFRM